MLYHLTHLTDAFHGLKVVVIGDAILDRYLHAPQTRPCPETQAPIVAIAGQQAIPGGAANVALNLQSLGAYVTFLSVVGEDHAAQTLQHTLAQHHVDVSGMISQRDRYTLTKQRIMSGETLLVRFDEGTTTPITAALEQKLIDRLGYWFSRCDAVVISDYGYGILTPRVIQAIAGFQAQFRRLLVVDAKDLRAYRSVGASVVKPNFAQALHLLEESSNHPLEMSRPDYISQHREQILNLTGALVAAVTLDSEGTLLLMPDHLPYRIPAPAITPAYPTGAGDTFMSALTLALGVGASVHKAAEIATAAAAIVVSKPGTATCTPQELHQALSQPEVVELSVAPVQEVA